MENPTRCSVCGVFEIYNRFLERWEDDCECYAIAQETKGERTLEQVREELGYGDIDDGSQWEVV